MHKLLVSYILWVCIFQTRAQNIILNDFDIFRGHRFGQIITGEDDTFYALHYIKVNMAYAIPKIRMYKGNAILKEHAIEHLNASGTELDQDFFVFQNKLLLLTESKQFGRHDFFLYSNDDQLEEKSVRIPLQSTTFKVTETLVKSGIVSSPDSTKLLFYALIEDVQNRTYFIHYTIFDEQLNVVERKSRSYLFPSANIELRSLNLSDDLNILAVFSLHAKRASRTYNLHFDRLSFFLIDLRKDENNSVKFTLPDKKVLDVQVLPTTDNDWRLCGTWSNEKNNSSGFFHSVYSASKNNYSEEKMWEYPQTEIITTWQGQPDLNNVKKKSSLLHFLAHDFFEYRGGYVAVFEEKYVTGSMMETDTGAQLNNLSFHWNNIIAIHFDSQGELLWTVEIDKKLSERSDNHAAKSFLLAKTKDELRFFFNDHKKNYDESGLYNGRSFPVALKKKDLVLAKTTLNLKYNNLLREVALHTDQSQAYFLPQKSAISKDNSHAILVFQQNLDNLMYRFGVLRLE